MSKPIPKLPHITTVGYWRQREQDNYEGELPWPKADVLKTPEEIQEALGTLSVLENHDDAYMMKMMGISKCRLCGCDNGSGEFWWMRDKSHLIAWPEGLKHYVAAHGVDLPDLIKYIAKGN